MLKTKPAFLNTSSDIRVQCVGVSSALLPDSQERRWERRQDSLKYTKTHQLNVRCIGVTKEYFSQIFGRMCDQSGRTLEPCTKRLLLKGKRPGSELN